MIIAATTPATAPPDPGWTREPLVRYTIVVKGQSRPLHLRAQALAFEGGGPTLVPLGSSLGQAVHAAAQLARRPGARVHEAVAVLQAADGAFHGARLGVNGKPIFVDGPGFGDYLGSMSLGRQHRDVQAVVGGETWFDMRGGYATRPLPLPALPSAAPAHRREAIAPNAG